MARETLSDQYWIYTSLPLQKVVSPSDAEGQSILSIYFVIPWTPCYFVQLPTKTGTISAEAQSIKTA